MPSWLTKRLIGCLNMSLAVLVGTGVSGFFACTCAPPTVAGENGQLVPWPYIGAVPMSPHQMYWFGVGCVVGSLSVSWWACNLIQASLRACSESQAELKQLLEQFRERPRLYGP